LLKRLGPAQSASDPGGNTPLSIVVLQEPATGWVVPRGTADQPAGSWARHDRCERYCYGRDSL